VAFSTADTAMTVKEAIAASLGVGSSAFALKPSGTDVTVTPSPAVLTDGSAYDINLLGAAGETMGVVDARAPYTIFLQPIAHPNSLGLFAFSAALFLVSGWWANWWNIGGTPNPNAVFLMLPFLFVFGFTQFACGMWSFRARDNLAASFHGIYGAFFMGLALYWLASAFSPIGLIGAFAYQPELGMVLIALCAFTFMFSIAAVFRDMTLAVMLFLLACADLIILVGFFLASKSTIEAGGWVFQVTSWIGWLRASFYIFEESMRRELPLYGRPKHAHGAAKVNEGVGEPGVKRGQ
jgi:succinate-acetate transporter protein